MKIKSFTVDGLLGSHDAICLDFNEDLNIFTGRNGSGKTTILKLMWYLISGNFDKAVAEINFKSATLKTDIYTLEVEVDYNNKIDPLKSSLEIEHIHYFNGFEKDDKLTNIILNKSIKNISWFLTQYVESSFFMPTFRIIEGGFTTEKYEIENDVLRDFYLKNNEEKGYSDIAIDLNKLSSKLSKREHKFITTISANDIDIFLVKKYAEIMKKVNSSQAERLNLMSKHIQILFSSGKKVDKSITEKIKLLEEETNLIKEPLSKLRKALIDFMPIFRISFDDKIYFYDTSKSSNEEIEIVEDPNITFDFDVHPNFEEIEIVELDDDSPVEEIETLTINNLSAGEKQILTFIAYNIFNNNTIFFIDEPELSLHVDWQSKIFSLLKEQNPTNQFIISTHSPFIYSLFPDKELVINDDKGCSEFEL
ncbi:AAA family ATPase [Acinetobacter baumannii]|uniref:AAA family ATPase n=1 Tax=Acinetobacter baumannii TaxID=470 RepID=UPI0024BCB28E|nr:AAA family ATPase [Acinetobacter baumannii]WFT03960.1 AAA family ATPase [Acinetobacter baumannii]